MASFINVISKNKLTLSFLLIIVLFISCGVITIKGLFTLGQYTRTIYDHPLVVSNASLNAALNITKMHRSMKDVVLANTPEEIIVAQQAVGDSEWIVFQQLDVVRDTVLGKEGAALEKQTRQLFEDWKPIRDEVVELLNSGNAQGAISITKSKGAHHVFRLETKMLELTSYARTKADTFLNAAEASQSRLENITVVLTLAGVVLCVIIAIVATHFVAKARKRLQGQRDELQMAFSEIKTLRGIIPICSHCKQIRDDRGLWNKMEEYIRGHSDAEFSHGICPSCIKENYPEYSGEILTKQKNAGDSR